MFLRSRAAVVLALAAGIAAPGAAHSAKTCLENEMTTLSEILREAQEADVFVRIDKQYAYGDDSKQYDELCTAYEKTSDERKKQVKIVKVNGDSEGGDIIKELDAEDEDAWPVYFLFKKGTKNSDLKPKALEEARYSGEERSSDKLAEYLHDKTGATIGSFVYSLGMMDTLASKFVSAKDSESAAFRDIQRQFILYSSKILGFMVKFRADSDLKMVADLYVKAFGKSMESDDYAQKQTDRIKKLMEKDNNMSNAKREQMSQKLHVLSKFTEPKELTAAENRSLLINIGMNVALFIAFIVTLLQMIFGSPEEEKKEEGDGDEADGDDENEEEEEDVEE
mmetsp:Transcript_5740/g.16162  ORF Transcript_5740/g.16162 Transcript_5740/m.16162 type:complete len:337 (-) Transcript_5740:151-1161(-)|eukprot:CAMPEP_0181051132 /NCGR_PEP_ID=MMETSP1070-20121207/16889_1 /TAXON_ID=265543 /ORGANISM="Minutocellus polymorphus, Strain NH13" /LENGTH=336 /DNA_ID=CAMNT_0023130129 /DNA_START=54 /DNA_END=1064 /DNA_ORIENTATION=+